jgi:hypothetical protein
MLSLIFPRQQHDLTPLPTFFKESDLEEGWTYSFALVNEASWEAIHGFHHARYPSRNVFLADIWLLKHWFETENCANHEEHLPSSAKVCGE